MPGCAHNIPAQAAMVDAIDRAISATHPSTDARRTSTTCSHKHNRTPAVQQVKKREFFCLFCQHAATALPRLPCHTPSCCALLYRGSALLMRPVQDAPRSQRPPGPPAAVCRLCDVQYAVPELCGWLSCFGYERVSSRLLAVCRCFWLPLFSFVMRLSLCATTRRPQSIPTRSAPIPWLRSRGVLCDAHSVCEGRFVGSRLRLLAVCFPSGLLSVAVHHHAPTTSLLPPHTAHTPRNTCTSTPLAPYTPCTAHTPHLPHIYHT